MEIQNRINDALASAADQDEKNILLEEALKADMHVETGPVKSDLSFEELKKHIKLENDGEKQIYQWEINIGDNFYVSQKIIDPDSEKYYRATVVSIDPDPRQYDAKGVYEKEEIKTEEKWKDALQNSWKSNTKVSWNKENDKFSADDIKYTIQYSI